MNIGRETYLAYRFRTGYHHVKMYVDNKNNSPVPVLMAWVVMLRKNYGSDAILISLLEHLNMMIFYIQAREEPTWASVIGDITKLNEGLFHNHASLAPQGFLFAFDFFGSFNTFKPAYIKLNLLGEFIQNTPILA